MYIQITTKCNMRCAHCCFGCEPGKGEHMSLTVAKKAIALSEEYGAQVSIGGGEPTLHPQFEYILCNAIAADLDMGPFIITNGTHKQRSKLLWTLAEHGSIQAYLSNDQYHDKNMVDPAVFRSFERAKRLWGSNPRPNASIVKSGRGKAIPNTINECACETIFVKPNGNVYECGCENAPKLGNVFDGITLPRYYEFGTCHNKHRA